jgi:two-component system sensor histidine kinase DegS
VLQEAVTNVAKHCPKGTVVEVTLRFADGQAQLRIEDRGPGFVVDGGPRDGHYGLANMRERANKVAGQIRVTSEPGKGTRIDLAVHAFEEEVHP